MKQRLKWMNEWIENENESENENENENTHTIHTMNTIRTFTYTSASFFHSTWINVDNVTFDNPPTLIQQYLNELLK